MSTRHAESLLARQWSGYPGTHRARVNLLLHIVAVPVFLAANVSLAAGLARGDWRIAVAAVAAMAASLAAQGRGHRWEATPPERFAGPAEAVLRILAEQWVTFPRFVLTGRWMRAVREGR